MALFNLDIERYYQVKKEEGIELKSIAYLQYPIYCIHATILDSTPDPLEKLDRAIIKCILLNNSMSAFDIANFLSVQKRGIELRIQQMKSEDLIEGENKFTVTERGKDILINATEKRFQKRQHNFYLDGIDFKPLSNELYSTKYLKSFFNENEFTYYTNSKGDTISYKPFKPNIVHEPLNKEKVLENIFNIHQNDREFWAIPLGLEVIETIDFTKMSMPILVGLMIKDNKPYREIIDGFSNVGDFEKIRSFASKIKNQIQKLELRIDTWKDKSENDKFAFVSNWVEIDKENVEDKLQFITSEDLKLALSKLYNVKFSSEEEIINTKFEIGINITEELLLNQKSNRSQLLRNLERGREYQRISVNNGIWIVFISFKTDSTFVYNLLEINNFLKDAIDKKLEISHITERLFSYKNYRQALVLLEEFELLEKIDINKHMHIEE
ncbi:hypothetical protein EV196_102386 [Mariniflexile fucanivorans]|uniref:Uncharacterized protein n=1 Tax=Mariniflexile fucanivorans TaxID=264023 RepID=A0A4R1RND3_9FLAO|nr:hypothetical protein [Mariniflexile fucanivorans]TCL67823.1 hypothetical protein EV196_102386 [Mariniflexile fucanivorans]